MPIKPFNSRPYEASGTSFGGKCDPPSPKLETRKTGIYLNNRTNISEILGVYKNLILHNLKFTYPSR